MIKKLQKLKPIDWILIVLVIFIPIGIITTIFKGLDNDLWYLLSEGRYIIQHGIYHTDVLSMHQGLDIVVQNWLSAVIFWITYAFLGSKGIFFLVMITNCAILYLLYKLCMLISENNKTLSILITILTDMNLSLYFIVSRPQIFSFVIMLLTLYLLELYIKNDDTKYLKYIPLLSFIEINLHASLWWFIFLFMIPYLIDSLKIKKLRLQGYRTKPLLITFIVSLLIGFINPYGYKAILFIFNSFGDKYMLTYIYELQRFSLNEAVSALAVLVIFITTGCYMFFREGRIRIRYICIYFGTLLLGMFTIKALSHFLLVASFPIAYLLKDIYPRKYKKHAEFKTKILYIIIIAFTAFLVGFTGINYYKMQDKIEFKNIASEAVDAMDLFTDGKSATVYVSFNDGGYLSFRGYKPYIDPRAEVYLKKNNHQKDIYKEYTEFELGLIDEEKFLKEYNFDFIIVKYGDRLFNKDSIDGYFVIYDTALTGYKVFARNDITTDEIRELLIEEYEKSKQKN